MIPNVHSQFCTEQAASNLHGNVIVSFIYGELIRA